MTELKTKKTIEEVYGYQATDGTIFPSREECEKYEKTAANVINTRFKSLMVGGEPFPEYQIWESFGGGSDEYEYAVIEMKNADDLKIANMYGELHGKGALSEEYIGKRILVTLGDRYCNYDSDWYPRTEEDIIEQFKKDVAKFFRPKKESEKNDT